MKQVVIAAFLCVIISSTLVAQNDSTQFTRPSIKVGEVSLTGGFSYPYLPEDSKNFWKKGWNAGMGIGMSFEPGSIGYVTLEGAVNYNRFAFDQTAFLQTLSQNNVEVSRKPTEIMTFMLNVKGSFSSTKRTVAPYFIIGIGEMALSAGDILVTGDTTFNIGGDSRSAFAWSFGVGIEVPITESYGFFVQGQSILGTIDPPRQYFPISFGLRFRRE